MQSTTGATNESPPPEPKAKASWSDDVTAIVLGAMLLLAACGAMWGTALSKDSADKQVAAHPWKAWVRLPGGWELNPLEAFYQPAVEAKPATTDQPAVKGKPAAWNGLGVVGAGLGIAVLFGVVTALRGLSAARYWVAFPGVWALAVSAYLLANQSLIKASNLEVAIWAIAVGLLISNTVGTPKWLRSAALTELYIKTGLVLLGAEVLLSRLLALGVPGVFVSWVVTPIVLITTFWFGQRVLRMSSRSLNLVISADMSVCGVSAAIATAAACKAKKEELSLAIGISLGFTAVMMVVMPLAIQAMGMDPIIGGAWIGGTIDSTGAVGAAAGALPEPALEVAAMVKMIQNILIGVISFGVAVYWVTVVERGEGDAKPRASEIWRRFPKFVLGFVAASLVFSWLYGASESGPDYVKAVTEGATVPLRNWLFTLAFVSIGLETNFRELLPFLRGGKPLVLYVVGQALNLLLTLLMAWLMFGVVFRDWIQDVFK